MPENGVRKERALKKSDHPALKRALRAVLKRALRAVLKRVRATTAPGVLCRRTHQDLRSRSRVPVEFE